MVAREDGWTARVAHLRFIGSCVNLDYFRNSLNRLRNNTFTFASHLWVFRQSENKITIEFKITNESVRHLWMCGLMLWGKKSTP